MIGNIDLQRPLTDHPIWKDVRGVWLPGSNTAGGDTLYDLSPYGNHGTLNGMDPATDWVATDRGLALDFDGTDYVQVNGIKSVDMFPVDQPVTFVSGFHANKTNFSVPGFLIDGGYNASLGMGLFVVGSPAVAKVYSGDGAATGSVTGTIQVGVADSQVASVFDGSYTRLYVGGVADGASALSTIAWENFTTYSLRIGCESKIVERFFSGEINNSFVFNRSLSPDEIATLYDQSLRGYPDLIRQVPTKRYFFPPIIYSYGNIFKSPIIRSA